MPAPRHGDDRHADRARQQPEHDVGEPTPLIERKFAELSFAVAIRAAGLARENYRAAEIAMTLGRAVHAITQSEDNQLTLIEQDEFDAEQAVVDILDREVRRSGMILSLSELATLVHLPSASVRSRHFLRQSGRTKSAPPVAEGNPLVLGLNEHDGDIKVVSLSQEQRTRHLYTIGASGTGKSTLLLSIAVQDITLGNGFAVLDPHGDLIDEILARIPEDRADDVILFDPADEDYPIGFNILSAHSELERTLLASDLVSVFKRLSTSFGDVMTSVLGNAVLAFLESSEGGTLIDLRDFLVDEAFRARVLNTVGDAEIVSYWRREFPLLKGMPHAPVLTRLNTFLRPKLIRRMVAQKKDRLDFRRIMDDGTIFLAKLSHGAIGEENAHLLGSLLVSRIAQAAMSRQNIEQARRRPYSLVIDEFHHFVTPSIATILSGARKYGLGLVLAHQESRQLRSRSEDVASSVLSNAGTRVVFRVGEHDARALADGFSFFESKDLQSLEVGQAVARIERADFDFNLATQRLDPVALEIGDVRREAVRSASRTKYAGSATEVDASLAASLQLREALPEEPPAARRRARTPQRLATESQPLPGRGGAQHKYLQGLVRRIAEARGFEVSTEVNVLDGHGYVDVVLEGRTARVAVEISVSTTVQHEVGNLTKCLAAGFDYAVLLSSNEQTLDLARAEMSEADRDRVRMMSPGMLTSFLDELVGRTPDVTTRPIERRRRLPREENASDAQSESLLTTKQAAAFVGLAVQTLAEMRVTGESPPFIKLGRRVFYERRELEKWLSERRRRSTSDPGNVN